MTDQDRGFDIRSTVVLGKPIELTHLTTQICESQRKVGVEAEGSELRSNQTLQLDAEYITN